MKKVLKSVVAVVLCLAMVLVFGSLRSQVH